MAQGSFKLEIVTPERSLLTTDASELVGPGWLGQFTILPGHRPMVIALRAGVIRYKSGGGEQRVAIDGGFAVIDFERVSVLADAAAAASEIDAEAARSALAEAERAKAGIPLDTPEYEAAEASFQRARAHADAVAPSR